MQIETQRKIFKQWLNDYSKLIFKVVRAYTVLPQDQEDLFQEILIHIYSAIPGFRGEAKETTWIYRISLNTALTWSRNEKRKRKRFKNDILDVQEVPAVKSDSDDPLQNEQILNQVYDAIRQLPKSDSSIVLLYLDGLSYDEISEIIGISKTNVGARLNRAKKKLVQLLKGLIDDF